MTTHSLLVTEATIGSVTVMRTLHTARELKAPICRAAAEGSGPGPVVYLRGDDAFNFSMGQFTKQHSDGQCSRVKCNFVDISADSLADVHDSLASDLDDEVQCGW